MGFVITLPKPLKAIGSQLTPPTTQKIPPVQNTTDVYFTPNFIQKAKEWHLSEKDALDVYYHGKDQAGKQNMRCQTYHGYELCIYYGHNERTGRPYISTIWKRGRR